MKQKPAYNPRKGAFFEHDLRMDLDTDEKQGESRGWVKNLYPMFKKNTILKQNPAYIPRKGAFLEHDLRMDPDTDEKQGESRGWVKNL